MFKVFLSCANCFCLLMIMFIAGSHQQLFAQTDDRLQLYKDHDHLILRGKA